jgi:hypothetical protein
VATRSGSAQKKKKTSEDEKIRHNGKTVSKKRKRMSRTTGNLIQ